MAGIQVEEITVDIGGYKHRKTDYMKLNPKGQIPFLIDGAHKFTESSSILRYLCHKHNVNESFYPRNDLINKTKVDAGLDYC
jgi:glutathione S-transferase